MGYNSSVKQRLITIGCLIFGLLLGASSAQADVAVLIQITSQSVSLERVERVDQSEAALTAETPNDSDATQRLIQGLTTNKSTMTEDDSKLLVRWYNALGELIHYEVLRDPRFIHAPGSPEMVLPEATQLLRAPNSAVMLRVKPRDFAQFIDFDV